MTDRQGTRLRQHPVLEYDVDKGCDYHDTVDKNWVTIFNNYYKIDGKKKYEEECLPVKHDWGSHQILTLLDIDFDGLQYIDDIDEDASKLLDLINNVRSGKCKKIVGSMNLVGHAVFVEIEKVPDNPELRNAGDFESMELFWGDNGPPELFSEGGNAVGGVRHNDNMGCFSDSPMYALLWVKNGLEKFTGEDSIVTAIPEEVPTVTITDPNGLASILKTVRSTSQGSRFKRRAAYELITSLAKKYRFNVRYGRSPELHLNKFGICKLETIIFIEGMWRPQFLAEYRTLYDKDSLLSSLVSNFMAKHKDILVAGTETHPGMPEKYVRFYGFMVMYIEHLKLVRMRLSQRR